MAYDGSIRINTRIDTSGFNSGVKKMESTAEGASSNIVNKFESKWQAMDWGGKQAVIERASSSYGDLWSTMGADEQHAALLKIVGDMEKMPEPVDKTTSSMKRLNVYGHGFTRILNAMVPGMYRMRRSAVGLNEMAVDMNSAAQSGGKLSSAIHMLPAILALSAIGVALLAKAAFNWAQKTVNQLYENLNVTSAFRDKVTELKGAFDSVKGATQALGASLLNALAPVLLKVIDWLVKAINWVSMFIAALTGQKTVMQYVSGATDSAATATGKLAKNTKDLEKAAEGALAAFDEINVLQMETEDESAGGGGTVGGNIIMQEVAVPEDFMKTSWEGFVDWLKDLWDKFKDWLKEKIWDPIVQKLKDDWQEIAEAADDIVQWLFETWGKFKDWMKEKVIDPMSEWFKKAWENIQIWAADAVIWIMEAWGNIKEWFKEHVIDPLTNFFSEAWENIKIFFSNAKGNIQEIWNTVATWFREKVTDPIKNFFNTALESIKMWFSEKWESIKGIWGIAASWFETNITDPIKNAFSTALDFIRTKWETTFSGIKEFVKNSINSIIDFINGMISAIATGINTVIRGVNSIKVTIPSWIPVYGGSSWGMNIPTVSTPQIPRLATGAVIPPNSEFAAILGDQRSGTNIEAPEGLIRQIIQEEIGNIQTDVEIKFGGSLGALIRELKPYIDQENTRIGSSLVKGNAT